MQAVGLDIMFGTDGPKGLLLNCPILCNFMSHWNGVYAFVWIVKWLVISVGSVKVYSSEPDVIFPSAIQYTYCIIT